MHPLALAASFLLHAAVVAWLVVAVPDFGERLAVGDVMRVDVVTLDETEMLPRVPAEAAPLPERAPTRTPEPTPPVAEPSPEPPGTPAPPAEATPPPAEEQATPAEAPAEPAPTETPAARPESAPTPPPPPAEAPAETVARVPEPEPPVASTEPAPEPAAESEPEPAEQTVAALPPPQRRPKPPARPSPAAEPSQAVAAEAGTAQPQPDTRTEARPEEDPLDALLQSVEQLARRVEADEAREGTGDADVEAPTGRLADLRAQQLGRLIYEQIVDCWNPPAGLEGLRDVGPVEVRAEFRQDGEVVTAEVADEGRLATDRVFRSVAESARRAVFNCTPLEGMPTEFYPQWRVVILEFRPDQLSAGG